jgi:hypothetical protein
MDGVTCHFIQSHEIDAWQAAIKSPDPGVTMFDRMLTNQDLDTLRVWSIDPRRETWQSKQ